MFASGAQRLPVARKFASGINMFAGGVPKSVCEFRAVCELCIRLPVGQCLPVGEMFAGGRACLPVGAMFAGGVKFAGGGK